MGQQRARISGVKGGGQENTQHFQQDARDKDTQERQPENAPGSGILWLIDIVISSVRTPTSGETIDCAAKGDQASYLGNVPAWKGGNFKVRCTYNCDNSK